MAQIFLTVYKKLLATMSKYLWKIYDRYRNSKLTNLIIDGAVFYRRESLEPALYSPYKTQKPIKII